MIKWLLSLFNPSQRPSGKDMAEYAIGQALGVDCCIVYNSHAFSGFGDTVMVRWPDGSKAFKEVHYRDYEMANFVSYTCAALIGLRASKKEAVR